MSKKIKITNTDLNVGTSKIDVVEIADFSFEKDERYPWVDLYSISNEGKDFVEQIDDEIDTDIVSHEDLKVFALNWFFKNVEVVEEID